MAAEFLPGNRITLLNSGAEYFPALFAAIDTAQSEIYLESYIFADDEIGHAVATALCLAAARGVRVNVTVDGFGARNFKTDFLPRLTAAGVQSMQYRPELGRFHFRRHRLRRLHRKLVVIDARVAFVGGINIVDDNNAPDDMCPRYDYAVRLEGPTLRQVHGAARRMWEIVSWANFKRRFRLTPVKLACCDEAGTQLAAFLIRDNIRHRNDILNAYIEAIGNAREEILIANAYFMPGVRFGRAIYAAAKRGVKITVLLQGKTDHPFLQLATQTLYGALLDNQIDQFRRQVDVRLFDCRSLKHAEDAGIRISRGRLPGIPCFRPLVIADRRQSIRVAEVKQGNLPNISRLAVVVARLNDTVLGNTDPRQIARCETVLGQIIDCKRTSKLGHVRYVDIERQG